MEDQDNFNKWRDWMFEHALDVKLKNEQGLDKVIFTLMTGAFALNVTYLLSFKDSHLIWPTLLMAGWLLTGIAIILHIAEYVAAISMQREVLIILNRLDKSDEVKFVVGRETLKSIAQNSSIYIIRNATIVSMIIGLA